MNVEIDGHVIHCHVQYTKGSKLTVTLDLPYMLTIKAPRHTSHEMLEQWVRERGDAIVRQSKLLAQRLEGRRPESTKRMRDSCIWAGSRLCTSL